MMGDGAGNGGAAPALADSQDDTFGYTVAELRGFMELNSDDKCVKLQNEGGALELCRQLRTSPSEGRAHRAVGYTGERGRGSGAVSPTEDVTQ